MNGCGLPHVVLPVPITSKRKSNQKSKPELMTHFRLATATEKPMKYSRCRFLGLGLCMQIFLVFAFGISFIGPTATAILRVMIGDDEDTNELIDGVGNFGPG